KSSVFSKRFAGSMATKLGPSGDEALDWPIGKPKTEDAFHLGISLHTQFHSFHPSPTGPVIPYDIDAC
ncbi:MAG: hypothetical protein ACE5J1_05935, partial [Nitrospiria bacterium]